MTPAKLTELRQRMINHEVENDTAIVKLTAQELEQLLEEVETLRRRIHDLMNSLEYME